MCVPQVDELRRELQQRTMTTDKQVEEARAAALSAMKREAEAWADTQRNEVRNKLMDKIVEEVS